MSKTLIVGNWKTDNETNLRFFSPLPHGTGSMGTPSSSGAQAKPDAPAALFATTGDTA